MIPVHSPPAVASQTHRLAVGALFFLTGLCFASWASRIPSVQQRLGLSEAHLGGVLLAFPLGHLLSMPVAGWLVARFGSRRVVLGGVGLYAAVLVGLVIGRNLYEEPKEILCFHDRFNTRRLRKHSVVAVETFISIRATCVHAQSDGWTMKAKDGSFVAQHEHTIVVTDGAPLILTASNSIWD